jgi:hypothetical protein
MGIIFLFKGTQTHVSFDLGIEESEPRGAVLKVYEPLTLSAQSAKGLKDASARAASSSGLMSSKLSGW